MGIPQIIEEHMHFFGVDAYYGQIQDLGRDSSDSLGNRIP